MIRNLSDSEKVQYIIVGIWIGMMIGYFLGLALTGMEL
tara:strand:+ start:347 stop:460 length:114 start_codon:yes stop_codon:yes gene_type:complete